MVCIMFLIMYSRANICLVEEFNPKPPRKGFFTRKKKVVEKLFVNPYALPEIPDGWKPNSVSWQQKRFDVTERTRKLPGFPKNREYYYTDAEIAEMKAYEAYVENTRLKAEAVAMVERREGRPFNELTRAEVRAAQLALGIDPRTEILTSPPPAKGSILSRIFGLRKAENPPPVQPNLGNERAGEGVLEEVDEDFDMELGI
jgi:hypothetical protein